MRIDPADVLLRLEQGAHVVNLKTGAVRSSPCVELHWKDDRKWLRRSFVASDDVPTLGAILASLGEWIDTFDNLDAMLEAAAGR